MNDKLKTEDGYTVRSVERAMDLLQALMSAKEPVSLKTLSEKVDLHPSTTHRLLSTMDRRKFVYQDPENKLYTLGPALMSPNQGVRSLQSLQTISTPILKEITKRLGESASLAIRSGNHAMLVAQASSERRVNVTIQAGSQVPLHCTAVGKVILAHMPDSEVERIAVEAGLPSITPNTLSTVDQLKAAVDRIRTDGFAADNEEWEPGIRCVAAPVYYGDGSLLGAVSISGPAGRVFPEKDAYFASVIRECTAHLM
jgi:IclR family acetate operon transcriptional repressor